MELTPLTPAEVEGMAIGTLAILRCFNETPMVVEKDAPPYRSSMPVYSFKLRGSSIVYFFTQKTLAGRTRGTVLYKYTPEVEARVTASKELQNRRDDIRRAVADAVRAANSTRLDEIEAALKTVGIEP